MNTELIAAILKLADAQSAIATAQNAIATQLGRIADQITPSENQTVHPGKGVDLIAYSLSCISPPDYSDEFRMIADAIEKRAED